MSSPLEERIGDAYTALRDGIILLTTRLMAEPRLNDAELAEAVSNVMTAWTEEPEGLAQVYRELDAKHSFGPQTREAWERVAHSLAILDGLMTEEQAEYDSES